jgi:hypothetical protein
MVAQTTTRIGRISISSCFPRIKMRPVPGRLSILDRHFADFFNTIDAKRSLSLSRAAGPQVDISLGQSASTFVDRALSGPPHSGKPRAANETFVSSMPFGQHRCHLRRFPGRLWWSLGAEHAATICTGHPSGRWVCARPQARRKMCNRKVPKISERGGAPILAAAGRSRVFLTGASAWLPGAEG